MEQPTLQLVRAQNAVAASGMHPDPPTAFQACNSNGSGAAAAVASAAPADLNSAHQLLTVQ